MLDPSSHTIHWSDPCRQGSRPAGHGNPIATSGKREGKIQQAVVRGRHGEERAMTLLAAGGGRGEVVKVIGETK